MRVSFVPLRESLGSDRDDAVYAELCEYRLELGIRESARTIRSYVGSFRCCIRTGLTVFIWTLLWLVLAF